MDRGEEQGLGDARRCAAIRRVIAGLAAQAEADLVQIAAALERALEALGRLHESAGAAQVPTDQVRRHVGQAMDALQIGDCTRQRLEHAAQALALIDARDAAEPINLVVIQVICGLMSVQLSDVADGFEHDLGRLVLALRGLTTSLPAATSTLHLPGDIFEAPLSLVETTRSQIGPVLRVSAATLAAMANMALPPSALALSAAREALEQIEASYAIAQEQVVHDRFLGRLCGSERSVTGGQPPSLDAALF
jgi:hypothetical protein